MPTSPFPPHLDWLAPPAGGPDLAATAPAEDITGAYPWPAGVKLSGELAALADCRGRRVADLGCGRGHLGFTALGLGAAAVVFNDASRAMADFVARTIAANRLQERAAVCADAWGGALPGGPCAVILGGDILYHPPSFAALIATIAASLDRPGLCLLSDPRTTLERELPELAASHGLGWSSCRRPAGYTLVRVARG